jgi:two-component system sensor histidine kinase YesM
MVQFGKGDFTVRCPEGAKDEAGRLSETFNQMAENINILVQKVYEEHLMKREAELKSLQMQINPHFLYNTLETINWMARVHGTEDIGIMVKSLGDLMRATINDKDYVMLADEINSLNNYLKIQKYRYGNKFEAGFEIDPNTKKLYVPKLILQPLVENAIYHGIEPSIEKGVIQIKTMLDNKELIITVYDSGIGMTHDTISRVLDINSKEDNFTSHSIGLQNVIRRIKTLFGDDYGLEIHSELGEWTRIIVRLPVMFEVPKDL